LKSSGISSSTTTAPSPDARKPKRFALTKHSVALDPIRYAVRPDLADIRLAEYVFAPHYAAPMAMAALQPVALRAGPEPSAATLAMLETGDVLETLDITAGQAWGTAPRHGLVGYVDHAALAIVPDAQAAE